MLVLYVILCVAAVRLAGRKGRSFGVYLVVGLLLGPMVWFAALVVPKHKRIA
jgi:hypothetical protein